jgi:hypothetical protein
MADVVGSFTAKVALRVMRVIAGNLCSYVFLTSLIFLELEKISKFQKPKNLYEGIITAITRITRN